MSSNSSSSSSSGKKSARKVSEASVDLAILEPIVDQLLSGGGDPRQVAERLAALGQPIVLDPTEQLRLALRLLECHDDAVGSEGKRKKSIREPEAGLA